MSDDDELGDALQAKGLSRDLGLTSLIHQHRTDAAMAGAAAAMKSEMRLRRELMETVTWFESLGDNATMADVWSLCDTVHRLVDPER